MDKAKLLKAAPAVGIIAGLLAACGLAGYIIGQWPVVDPALKPPIITGAFTILAAMGGALVVLWQLRRQAANTIDANRKNEAIKLKKEVYEELVEVCRDGTDAGSKLYHYVQRFALDVGLLRHVYTDKEKLPPELVPKQRYKVMRDIENDLAVKVARLIRAVQRWEIVNPKLDLFKYALNNGVFDIQAATKQYHLQTMAILPFADVGPLNMTFNLPDEEGMAILFEQTDNVCRAVARVQQWIADMQVELQNELLGELFSNKVTTRNDPDPTDEELAPFKVLRLDRRDELVSYFENDTEWGRRISAMRGEMSEDELSTPPLTTEPRSVKELGQPPLSPPPPRKNGNP
jgi:hypothetical protein